MSTPLEPLTALQREMLEFERATWASLGRREAVIRERFGVSITIYSQRLQFLLRRPEALEYDPTNVRRLIRLRDKRAAYRSGRPIDGTGQ